MAQYRQSGNGGVSIGGVIRNGVASGQQQQQQQQHLSIGILSGASHKHQQSRYHHRRLKAAHRKISITALLIFLLIAFVAAVIAFFFLSSQKINSYYPQDDEIGIDTDFLTNVTRTPKPKVLKFGRGKVAHGRDSHYWDRDDRRRDDDYSEQEAQKYSADKDHDAVRRRIIDNKSSKIESHKGLLKRNSGLYNEAGRGELKRYEAEYEASLNIGKSRHNNSNGNQLQDGANVRNQNEKTDVDDEYDDVIDAQDVRMDEYSEIGDDHKHLSDTSSYQRTDGGESSGGTNRENVEDVDESSKDLSSEESLSHSEGSEKIITNSRSANFSNGQSGGISVPDKKKNSRKKSKRHKYSGCEMKILDSAALLVEPLESRKFARFSLQYTNMEERPSGNEQWEPRFAGHQSLKEREESFIAHDQVINCGFVKGPKGSPSTGFDLAEDDAKYMSSCHIAVVSCIFGNSDRLRSPATKMVSKLSRKNVCFVMFVDEYTLQTVSSEGQLLDTMGFIGLWKIVVVKNLPYSDMRRVGKIPKFLSHRLFPSARYSIWLDSKLRLQLDPLLILEYFLWRKGHEYAISNHYDRHCVWEEVAQNKKLNKFNHTVIDEQFAFYQADGLKRFNASDPNKLLPSNVPEGSLIVRAHTPMSNLFSCLWFNEVDRFTPRDQLSFAYTHYKLRTTNPEKHFYLHMFKDCERRKIAKLFRHRSEEKRNISQRDTE